MNLKGDNEQSNPQIVKMEEALKWAEDYRNSYEPEIPKWAKHWKEQLGK